MSENEPDPASLAELRKLLHTLADLLRHARTLGPDAHALLADLIDELGAALESPEVATAEIAWLTECTSQLMQAVKNKERPGVLAAAEERLESAVVAVETGAPGLANLTRRLAEMLSDVGI